MSIEQSPESFDWGEPISVYDDAQAVEDGVLVAINERDRATSALFAELTDRLPEDQPPGGWQVPIFAWVQAPKGKKGAESRAVAALRGLTEQWRHRCTSAGARVYLWAIGHPIASLETEDPGVPALDIILALNERGGVTAMLPGDD